MKWGIWNPRNSRWVEEGLDDRSVGPILRNETRAKEEAACMRTGMFADVVAMPFTGQGGSSGTPALAADQPGPPTPFKTGSDYEAHEGVSDPEITAIAPWFGCNRVQCTAVGKALGRCLWVGVVFMGGAPELPHIDTGVGLANDLHRHVINLARVIRDHSLKSHLAQRLSATLFHPDELKGAQARCVAREAEFEDTMFGSGKPMPERPDLDWAYDFFVAAWMGRSATAGTASEFNSSLSYRWTVSGGDSNTRFRSAVASLDFWSKALAAWNFACLDCFAFIDECNDLPDFGIYADPPWPEDGDVYRFRFTPAMHRRLAQKLLGFKAAKVVVRINDHPLVREIYPETEWTWDRRSTKDQHGQTVSEVLICRNLGGSSAAAPADGASLPTPCASPDPGAGATASSPPTKTKSPACRGGKRARSGASA